MELMTYRDALQALKICRKTLDRMIASGFITPPERLGNFRKLYFRRDLFEMDCARAFK